MGSRAACVHIICNNSCRLAPPLGLVFVHAVPSRDAWELGRRLLHCPTCVQPHCMCSGTGIVGFAKDFETTASFSDAGTDEIFTLIQTSAPAPGLPNCLA